MEKKDDILAAMETLSGKERMNTLCAEIDKHIKKNPEFCYDWIVNLQTISQSEKDADGFFQSQLYLGEYYFKTNNHEKALEYSLRCIKLAKQNQNSAQEAEALLLKGRTEIRKGAFQEAVASLTLAKDISRQIKNPVKEAEAYYFMGDAYRLLSEFENSISSFRTALEIQKKNQLDKRSIANSCNNLGVAYLDSGLYEKALGYFFKALDIYEEIPAMDMIYVTLSNIGNIYFFMQEMEKALEHYKKALEYLPENKNPLSYSQILNNIGGLYVELKYYDKAKEYFISSLEIKREIGDKQGMSSIYNNLGEIAINEKDYQSAQQFLEKSLLIKKELGLKNSLAQTLLNLGHLKLLTKRYDETLPILEESETIANQLKSSVILWQIYAIYADFYKEKKDFEKAYQYYVLSTELKEEVTNENSKRNIRELQAKYELEKKEKEKEIYRLKNDELAEANKAIQQKNQELNYHREHLRLINKILRHDLINFLATIQSSIRLFRGNRDWEMLLQVEDSVNQSVQLIDRMRELESILLQHKQLKPIDLREILEEKLLHYQQKIEWELKGEGKALADEAISSIFDNIISNAILHGDATNLDISIIPHKKYYEVRIADNGIGVPDEIKEKVFEESFTHGKKGNTGLGLFIVKKTIEGYQGAVYIEDNKPKGAVFVLLFRRIK